MKPRTKSDVKQDKDLMKRVNLVCGPVLDWLGATHQFEIVVEFVPVLHDEDSPPKGCRVHRFSAQVYRRYPYRQLVITLSREALEKMNDSALRGVMIHEVFHEVLAGDFERALANELEELPLESADISIVKETMHEQMEDIIDRATHFLQRAFEEGGP